MEMLHFRPRGVGECEPRNPEEEAGQSGDEGLWAYLGS